MALDTRILVRYMIKFFFIVWILTVTNGYHPDHDFIALFDSTVGTKPW